MMKRIGYRLAVARQTESLEIGRRSVAAALDGLDLRAFAGKTIGLAGIGASYQAALAGALYLRASGIRAVAYTPTDLYGRTDAAADVFIALSASGQSREIFDVMREASASPRLAICRGSDNPLADLTGAALATDSGDDNGASSTGYTGTLLALGMLIDRLAGNRFDWARLSGAVATVLSDAEHAAGQAARLLQGRTSIDIVGAGVGFANAGEAAMLIREAVRVPASGWDTLNYLHGPMESQDAATGLIVIGDGREVKIAQDVAGFGCPSVLVTRRSDVVSADRLAVISVPALGNALADAILEIVAIQLVVGNMQDAAGLTDIVFRYRQTDTKLRPWSPTEV
ncbi:SIS domain-containing protein [Mesorhizobium sp. CA13]|uniref:SIS domain-containing protein n=1 Tax=unclassified Mesorhizobium TaxID=325217 RepID=UPI00112CBBF5|nr:MULTISPECIES: SIS domain-containing protein [unclassified Mesorhizobium]MBZ9857507.1 SIS domain-containing protein [Mesorhizobium sp. CA13]MBZ9921462.1 SIS domain-containing protein [Mesorhizobium sp. BR1-1-7]MBZ9966712.1 SIS domain-containing protein [Mesorhizobium sp. BR1-1-2]MCA0014876.1 SIS domain-containing protein [Mesorhizobium sp. B294B1A1]MCA0041004.1 SIS domain-containing protein [Mesorhizobium sp. B292B1B]